MQRTAYFIFFFALLIGSAEAAPNALRAAADAPTATQHFAFGRRVSKRVAGVLKGIGLRRLARVQSRQLLQVDGSSLADFTAHTSRGYLEVMVPENTGHVWFRYGDKTYDFYQKGFRVSDVRPIGSKTRYGALIKLNAKQEAALSKYLNTLQRTKGAELGKYDFEGTNGYHCVTWMMRLAFDGKRSLARYLGGKKRHGDSMPAFADFVFRRAKNVEALAIYSDNVLPASELEAMPLNLMSLRELRAQASE